MNPAPPVASRHAPRGMVCAVDHLAASAGVSVLRKGGSAADAAVATSAVLAVTCQHACGMGGDLWAVVHPGPEQAPVALDASGHAGSGADPERLRLAGHAAIPAVGHPSAAPVPGCVDGWLALHQRFGRLALGDVLEPARAYAEDGFPASVSLVEAAAALLGPSSICGPDGAADYLAGGETLRAGQLVRRPGVARALAALACGDRGAFYQGEFGDGLLAVGGGEYTPEDLARYQADWVRPLELEAWGHRLWTTPPSSQGYLTLASSWIASELDLPLDPEDPTWAHLLVEASRQAGHDRPAVLHDGADGQSLLASERLGPRRDAITPTRSSGLGVPTGAGDTIAVCAVDSDRQGVALVQSNASGWGCGLVVPGIRIFLHNRGTGFSLEPGHPAEYGPGRRPPHTLSPTLVTDPGNGRLRAVLGTMGGDAQPQILLQLLARLLHAGQGAGEAVSAGRFVLGPPGPGSGRPRGFDTWTGRGEVTVRVEGHAPAGWVDGLEARGHAVVREEAYSGAFGHANMISVEGGGGGSLEGTAGGSILAGGADPRPRSGAAASW